MENGTAHNIITINNFFILLSPDIFLLQKIYIFYDFVVRLNLCERKNKYEGAYYSVIE
jgi:hypothetical protein